MNVNMDYEQDRQLLHINIVIPQMELSEMHREVSSGVPLITGRALVDALSEHVLTLMRIAKGGRR